MTRLLLLLYVCIFLFSFYYIDSYFLPYVNLGSSNFLDGGPLRPKPGWYWTQYIQYYYSDIYTNACGKSIDKNQSPAYNGFATLTGVSYQFKPCDTAPFQVGFDASFPILLYSKIGRNRLVLVPDSCDTTSSGSGFGDFSIGTYIQFDAISCGRSTFVHRIEFDAYIPTGKYDSNKTINPGNNLFYIDPYWAFTFYFIPEVATSWRIQYLHCTEDHKINLKPGDAIHFNYTLETEAAPDIWVGINGYFLRQITNSKINNIEIPHSKEEVFSTGFGALWQITPDDNLFVNLFFECIAKNRPQGINLYVRFFKHF
jgi:hypothetical protein